MTMKVLHLISGGDTGGAKTHVITLLSELKKHVDIKLVCFIKADPFYSEAVNQGIDIEILKQNQRYDLRVITKLVQMIQQEKFDIVHCHGARANFIGAIVKRKVKVPFITTVHSDYLLDFDKNIYTKILYKSLVKKTNKQV